MRKKYLKKTEKSSGIRGAYDKDGKWWFEQDIKTFTSGMIKLCFAKNRNKIEIIDK